MICSICNNEIPVVFGWAEGNNAYPLSEGRCCDACNVKVIKARMDDMLSEMKITPHRKIEILNELTNKREEDND